MTTGLIHGTTTGYSHYKCRCDLCRAAAVNYDRKRTQAIKAGTWNPVGKVIPPSPCTGPGCGRDARYKNPQPLCGPHYGQLRRTGELKPLRKHRKVVDGMKECSRCGDVKPLDEFNRQTAKHTQSACRPCQSILNRARRYGMTFDAMRQFMRQSCAGCGSTESLHVDHCHDTNKVRGVLCHNCNTVLTKHMTPTILRRLAEYLEL